MNIKLITCDWEGCISEPGGGIVPWPTDNIARLSRLINLLRSDARYPPFVLCSGRQIPYGEAALQAINAFWDYMPSILENGSALYFPKTKKVLWNPLITDSTQKAIIEIHRQLSVDIKQMDLTKEIGKEYCISLNPPVTMDIEFLYQYMIEQLKDYSELIEVTHSKSAVDITPKGVNKGSGVRFLSDVTGIGLDDMVGIGDTEGDLPMLNLVGHPTGPSNADESVRRISKYISAYRTTNGVIDIICQYTGINISSL